MNKKKRRETYLKLSKNYDHMYHFFQQENPNQLDPNGMTALIKLVKQSNDDSNPNIIEKFVKGGANVNLPDQYGTPPLFHAIEKNKMKTMEALLNHGANVFSFNAQGIKPLKMVLSARNLNIELVDLILDRISKDYLVKNNCEKVPDEYFLQLIFDNFPSTIYSRPHVINSLLIKLMDKGIDINTKSRDGTSFFAKAMEDFDARSHRNIEELLRKGADINAIDGKAQSVFWLLIDDLLKNDTPGTDSSSIIQFYIEYGGNLNFVNEANDKTILMKLVCFRHENNIRLVESLIEQNIFSDLSEKDSRGYTALEYALINANDNIVVVKKLLEKEPSLIKYISVDFLNNIIRLPTYYDYENIYQHQKTMTKYVKEENYYSKKINKIKLLFEFGLQFDDDENSHEIHQRGHNNLASFLMFLIKKSKRDEYLPAISILLQQKVNLHYMDNKGYSIIACCIVKAPTYYQKKSERHNYGIARLLLNHGADYKKCYKNNPRKKYNKPFIAYINQQNEEHKIFWKIIQQIEYMKYNKDHSIMSSIKNSYHKFTLHPDSMVAQLTSIKWQLQQKSPEEVYEELHQEKATLMDYFGIIDGDSLVWKVEDQLAHFE